MSEKQRLKWLDIAKGIAVLCVIIGHTVNGTIQGIISSFHMPLFFLLAGYTFRKVSMSEMKAEIKKDAVRLLIPYIVVSLIRILIDICFCHQRIGETFIKYSAAAFLGYGTTYLGNPFWFWLGATWFLAALFWSRLVYRFILLYVKSYRQMFILMLAFFSIWLGQIIWLPQSWDLVFPCLIFMEAGYLMKNYEQDIKQEIWKGIGIAAFFIWTIYLHFSRGGVKLSLAGRLYDKYTLGILIALLACICIIQFCRSIETCKMTAVFVWLGQHSLALLCIHNLDGKYEMVKGLWDAQSKMAVLSQGWLAEILRRHDMMKMYDSWNHVLTNGVVVCQRILLDLFCLFLFVWVKDMVRKGKKNIGME